MNSEALTKPVRLVPLTWPERLLCQLFPLTTIKNCDGDIYLLRWKCFHAGKGGEGFGIYIHEFLRSDDDRSLHDHPWSFIVMPLWRGYVEYTDRRQVMDSWPDPWNTKWYKSEMVTVKRRVLPVLGTRMRPATYRHRVELIDGRPAWSLFFRFKRIRVWGFWPKEGFIPFNKWWTQHCE